MGGKTQQSSQQVSIPPEVLARYNSVNAQAQQTAQTPFQQYSSDPNAFVSPMTTAQNFGLQQTANYANAAQPGIQAGMDMTQAASGAANPGDLGADQINKYMSPYTSNVTNQMTALMNQQNQQAQSGQMGNAMKSGAFGGDRAGIAAANLGGQQSLAYGNAMAPVLQQGYNTALQTAQGQQAIGLQAQQANLARMMQGGQQMAGLGTAGQTAGLAGAQAMMGAGQVQQQTQQAGLTALYNQFLQQQSYPFQVSQFLANIAEGTGALSGQTTSTTQPSSFFSDRRLKENVKRIGTAKNGLPIHSFNYKDDPDKLTRLGFMADEVEHKHPDAVGLAGGYKTVDYGRAVRASGGGVVTDFDQGRAYGRGGYDDGGLVSPYNPWGQLISKEAQFESGAGLAGAPSNDPYTSANRHVPKQSASGPQQRRLTPGQMPPQQKTGLQTAGDLLQKGVSGYKDLKGMAGDAKDMYHDMTGGAKTTAPETTTPAPAAPAAPVAAAPTPAAKNPAVGSGGNYFSISEAEPAAVNPTAPATNVAELLPTDGGSDGLGAAANVASDVMQTARGGRIGRDMGGGLLPLNAPSGVNMQPSPAVMDARMRQNTAPTWSGPFARGGLADGGQPVLGAPAAGVPDVVAPTEAYKQGLGEAQAAQAHANEMQAQMHATEAADPFKYSPDLSPFGETLLGAGAMQNAQAFGGMGKYSPTYSNQLFARGGLADGGDVIPGESGGGGGLDIPDDKSWQQDKAEQKSMEPAPQKSGGDSGGGGLGAIVGLATKILPMFALNRGGFAEGGGDPDVADVGNADLPGTREDAEAKAVEDKKTFGDLPHEEPKNLSLGDMPTSFARAKDAGDDQPVADRNMAPPDFTAKAPVPSGPPKPFDEYTPTTGLAGAQDSSAGRGMAPAGFTPNDRSVTDVSPFTGPSIGAAQDRFEAGLDKPRAQMPGLNPQTAIKALNAEDMADMSPPKSTMRVLPETAPSPPPTAGGKLPLPPVMTAAAPTTAHGDNQVRAYAPKQPSAADAPASQAIQPHLVRTVPVQRPAVPPPPIQQYQSSPGIPMKRNVHPNSPATIHSYNGWQPPTVGQVFQRAGEIAKQYGINPTLFQRMIQEESGGLIDNMGDNKSSFGLIQAHFGGMNPRMPHSGMGDDMRRAGINVFNPKTWEDQLKFAANHIARNGSKGWAAWTTTMRKLGYNYASGGLVPRKTEEV